MTALPQGAALKIARWLEPSRPWRAEGASRAVWFDLKNPAHGSFDPSRPSAIHAAEQVAVQRGDTIKWKLYDHLNEIVRDRIRSGGGAMWGPCDVAFATLDDRALALLRLVEELENS